MREGKAEMKGKRMEENREEGMMDGNGLEEEEK